jgi:exonuclease I
LVTSNPDNAKEIIFYNLNEEVTDDVINSRTRSIGGLFKNKILKKIKSNDYPIFLEEKHMNNIQKKEYLGNKGIYEERANVVKASNNFIMNVNQYLVDQLADYQIDSGDYMSASDHVDEMLYRGFTGPSDWKIIQQLSKIENAHDLDKELNSLEDKRLVELYKRKMYSDRNDMLTEETRKKHQDYIKDKISNIGEKLPWTTLAKARRELDKATTDSRFSGMEDQFKKIDNFLNNIEKKFL